MASPSNKPGLLERYGPWVAAAVLGLYIVSDRFPDITPALEAAGAVAGAVQGSLTLATFVEQMLYVLVSLVVVVAILRFFDRQILGVKFSVWHNKIKTNATACAIYTGLRFLAVCVLVGLVLG